MREGNLYLIKINEVVIVEGKYDKVKLSGIIDGLIIETNGFQIFKDKDKLNLIRRLAKERGILIITDSDSAGFMIRNHIKSAVDESLIKNAYIPDIYGKEKRKTHVSKEGKLGVEGMEIEVLLDAIKKSGVDVGEDKEVKHECKSITKLDLYEDGFSGRDDSKEKRAKLLKYLNLPERLSANSLLKVLNSIMTYEEYKEAVLNIIIY